MRPSGRWILAAALGAAAMTAHFASTLDINCTGQEPTLTLDDGPNWNGCGTIQPEDANDADVAIYVDSTKLTLAFNNGNENNIATLNVTGENVKPKLAFTNPLTFEKFTALTRLIFTNVQFEPEDVSLVLPNNMKDLHFVNTTLTNLSLDNFPNSLTVIELRDTAFLHLPAFLYERKYTNDVDISVELSSLNESTSLSREEYDNLTVNIERLSSQSWVKDYTAHCTSGSDSTNESGSTTITCNSSDSGASMAEKTTEKGNTIAPTENRATSSQSSSGSTSAEAGTSSSGGLSTGALVAIIVVVIVIVLALAFLIMRMYFKRKAANAGTHNEASATLMGKGDASGDKGSFISNDEFLRNFRLPQSDVALVKSLGTGRLWMGEYNDGKVIVKRVESEVSDSYVTKALMAQARIFATISHPNITNLVGVTWLAGTDFAVVAEFMDKGNLKTVLTNADVNLDVSAKLQMCLDVAQALAYLHETEQNLCAKQLSSRKVLVNKAMACKLSLFECVPSSAKLGGPGSSSTYSYGMGEVAWLPPEVITRSSPMDARKNNIYAFGVLVSEIFTRVSPYQTLIQEQGNTMSDVELVKRVRRQEPMVPHENRREYLEAPANVRQLVEQCLSYAPMSRPTAVDLVNCFHSAKEELQTNSI